MISSEIVLTSINSIKVERAERHRTLLSQDKISELADSISRNGLIHTILIHGDALVAGEHRLEAFRWLRSHNVPCNYPDYQGWNLIPTRQAYDVNEHELAAIELEENIKRSDMSWQDQVRAVNKYHMLRVRLEPTWAANSTAKALGISGGSISRFIQVASELEAGNTKILKSAGISSAYNIISRAKDRQVEAELETLLCSTQEPDHDAAEEICRSKIEHANFLEWAPQYAGPRFNLIHCDFPYGINFDEARAANSSAEWRDEDNLYEDDPDTYWALVNCLIDNRDRLMAASCHIMFWFSMKYYTPTVRAFESSGFWVFPYPLIWHKSDGKGIIARPDFEPRRTYETALLMSRGDRKLVAPTAASYAGPTIKEIHTSEKPEPMLRYFMRMLVDEHSEVLDPTCGSGTSIRAAESLGAKRSLGLELSAEYVGKAEAALLRAVKMRALSHAD
jgi:DNA modification methylase